MLLSDQLAEGADEKEPGRNALFIFLSDNRVVVDIADTFLFPFVLVDVDDDNRR